MSVKQIMEQLVTKINVSFKRCCEQSSGKSNGFVFHKILSMTVEHITARMICRRGNLLKKTMLIARRTLRTKNQVWKVAARSGCFRFIPKRSVLQ